MGVGVGRQVGVGQHRRKAHFPGGAGSSESFFRADVTGGGDHIVFRRGFQDLQHLFFQLTVVIQKTDQTFRELIVFVLVVKLLIAQGIHGGEPDEASAHLPAGSHRERIQPACLAVQHDAAREEKLRELLVQQSGSWRCVVSVALHQGAAHTGGLKTFCQPDITALPRTYVRRCVDMHVKCSAQIVFQWRFLFLCVQMIKAAVISVQMIKAALISLQMIKVAVISLQMIKMVRFSVIWKIWTQFRSASGILNDTNVKCDD